MLSVVFSLLLPGLGHVYLGRFPRGLIWFGGVLAIGAITGRESVDDPVRLGMLLAISAFAALDAWLISRG